MIGTVYRFEVGYHLRRPVTYLYMLVFFMLAFLFTGSDVVQIGGAGGLIKNNSPFVLAQLELLLVLVGQVILTALVGTAVLRDYLVGSHELLFTTPITRAAYLGGRFLGVLTVMVLVHLAIPIGAMIGTFMPWVDHEKLLPFAFAPFFQPFVTLILPSVLLLTAIFFAVGALTRSLFAIYTQGIFLLVAYTIVSRVTENHDNRHLGALLDPFALGAFSETTRYWTVAEKNTLLVPMAGDLLLNRLIWSGFALGLFALTYALFRFRSEPPVRSRRRKLVADAGAGDQAPVTTPVVTLGFGKRALWGQFLSTTRLAFFGIVREVPFLAITTIGIVNLVIAGWYSDSLYGQTTWPVTYTILDTLAGQFSLFFIILTTIYAGEAVWRERQLKLDQISDALPVPSGITLLGKFVGLALVDVVLLLILIATGVVIQTLKGYHHYELGLYFRHLFGTNLPSCCS